MVMTGCRSVARVRGQMLTGNCFLCVKLTALEEADLVSEAFSSDRCLCLENSRGAQNVSENSEDLGFRPSLLTQELSPQASGPTSLSFGPSSVGK